MYASTNKLNKAIVIIHSLFCGFKKLLTITPFAGSYIIKTSFDVHVIEYKNPAATRNSGILSLLGSLKLTGLSSMKPWTQ